VHLDLDRIPDLVTDQVDRVRDRAAETVGADGGSVLRELGKLKSKLDSTEKHLSKRLDEIADQTAGSDVRFDDLEATLGGGKGTTWPRRLFWITVGLGAGAAAAYLADPDRGEQRRQEIVGQAQARVQATTDDVTSRAQSVVDQAVDRGHDVKDQAVTSARAVADEAQHAAQDVAEEAQHAAEDVAEEAQHAADDVKRQASTGASPQPPTNAPTSTTPPPSTR
jgi:gas vesicle protein